MIELINDPVIRRKAAHLFGQAIQHRWQIPAREAIGWVEEEFLHEDSFVFAETRGWRLCAVICGCPLVHVNVSWEEKLAVAVALGLPADRSSLPNILHICGLAVNKYHEHCKLVRKLHDAVREEAKQRGYAHIVGQTFLPTARRNVFAHHWMRVRPMGWRMLDGIHSNRLVKDVPISWLVLR